jgi:acyl carrier protein
MWDNQFEELLRRYLPYLPAGEKLAENSALRDFGLDSLAMVELLSALEGTYDIRFADDALTLETFETAGTLWRTLSASPQPTA